MKLVQIKTSGKNKDVTSSPDSSTDSSRSSPTFLMACNEPNPEAEAMLPSVVSVFQSYRRKLVKQTDIVGEVINDNNTYRRFK